MSCQTPTLDNNQIIFYKTKIKYKYRYRHIQYRMSFPFIQRTKK